MKDLSHPDSNLLSRPITLLAISWVLFQLWYASPLPFQLGWGILNDTEARSIHLAFAVLLAFMVGHKSHTAAVINTLIGLIAAFCAAYLFLFYTELANRPGLPTQLDLAVSAVGLLTLLEATRRSLGWPLVIVVSLFLLYSIFGPYMPTVIAHQGVSLNKLANHQWLGTEGVFGIALGVSTGFVFLFVLFGALLDKAGAGQYFLQTSFALLGYMRGGPAKAAVVSSGLSGIISGSSIANVVTTGTFTIPLMKKTGFPASKAGAIEVAASTNGQLTPPVMGAAAFLMVEYVGISYIEVVKHAILPALISYMALIYIVHLEACKAGMHGNGRISSLNFLYKLLYILSTLLLLMLLSIAVYYGLGWLKEIVPDLAHPIVLVLVIAAYIGLLWYAGKQPQTKLSLDELEHLPGFRETLKTGLHFLLPVVILLWCLTVERLSPGLSAYWATLFMFFILLTQRPLTQWLKHQGEYAQAFKQGVTEMLSAFQSAVMNMIGIGVATAAAGIVVGAITLTGLGLVMIEFVELISGGELLLVLLFTAIICLLLGMGLPTTANYIVVSSLMAPVIVTLAGNSGLVVPLIAAHLFVFYFGILADDTPPVGLAAYAAAGIAQADPIKTGIQGFTYDIRTAILPFMFIFNTQLLLIGIDGPGQLVLVIATASVAMLMFSAATQGYWLTKSRWWETILLLVIAFILFRPGFFWDRLYPPQQMLPVTELQQVVKETPKAGQLVIQVKGETLEGDKVDKAFSLQLPEGSGHEQRLGKAGLYLGTTTTETIAIDMVNFGSAAQKAGLEIGWQITGVIKSSDRPSKYWMLIPAVGLLLLVAIGQKKRVKTQRL